MSQEVSKWSSVKELFHLLINGVFWRYNSLIRSPLILTSVPGHPSSTLTYAMFQVVSFLFSFFCTLASLFFLQISHGICPMEFRGIFHWIYEPFRGVQAAVFFSFLKSRAATEHPKIIQFRRILSDTSFRRCIIFLIFLYEKPRGFEQLRVRNSHWARWVKLDLLIFT